MYSTARSSLSACTCASVTVEDIFRNTEKGLTYCWMCGRVRFEQSGWQLGEHGEWCKQTAFELATRVPLMIQLPGPRGAASRGRRARALVELVDMYALFATESVIYKPRTTGISLHVLCLHYV